MKRTEKVSTRRKTAPITGLPLIFILISLLATVGFAGPDRHPQGKDQQPRAESVNLIPKIKRKKLKPGLNLFHTFSTGAKVWAKVEADEIVDWVFTDRNGQEHPSAISRKVTTEGRSVGYCKKCAVMKDENGTVIETCSEIPCPKTTK